MRRCAPAPYLVILAVVLLAYGPALFNGFVWDDTALVLRDPLIRSPWLLGEGLRHFLFLDATPSDFYRPLQRVIYTLDYALGGFKPWIYHLTSILIHAAAAVALFEFGRRLLARVGETDPLGISTRDQHSDWLVLAASLLWAIHPVHTSAVVYVAGLADPLAALLGFGGLALLLARHRVAAGFCLGGALFAKESGIFAVLIGLGFAWQLSKEAGIHVGNNSDKTHRYAKFARVAVPALLMVGLYLGLRTTAERVPPPTQESTAALVRPILALRAVAEYGGLLIAPLNLRMERDVTTHTGGDVQSTLAAARLREFQTLLGAALLCGAVYWFRRRSPGSNVTRACLLAALVAYLPVSNLFSLNATVAEHWIYIPSAFLFLAIASDLASSALVKRYPRPIAAAFCGLFAIGLAALGVRTALRCGDWRTPETFFQSTIRSGSDSSRMFTNLAQVELNRGDLSAAVGHYQKALALKPNQPFAMLGLSGALIRQRSWTEAREWVGRCEAIPLVRAEALVDHAILDFQQFGKDRVDLLKEAAAFNPHFWPLRKRYISHLIERDDEAEALRELREVLSDQPFRAEPWQILGGVLDKTGQPLLAKHAIEEANWRDIHLEQQNRQ